MDCTIFIWSVPSSSDSSMSVNLTAAVWPLQLLPNPQRAMCVNRGSLNVETVYLLRHKRTSTNITTTNCIFFFFSHKRRYRSVTWRHLWALFWETCYFFFFLNKKKKKKKKATESVIHQSPFLSWSWFLFRLLGESLWSVVWCRGERAA